ncbi:MAG: hypothetical protein D6693_08245 [Planctomycetota bacterium]|nr:MAG: hypothetical protein D6693_08245 [Planctomycetota bacterium]
MSAHQEVSVERETEARSGWVFTLRVGAAGASRPVTLRLSWADYDRFGGGRASPAEVARAAARAALDLGDDELPDAMDAATLARRWPRFSDRLRNHLPR